MLVLQQSELVLGLLVFIALMLAVEGLYLLWRTHRSPQANRMRRRLEALSIGNTPKASALKARMARESPWVQDWLEREKLGSLMVMQVHDELVLEVPEQELALVQERLPQLMAGVATLKVPLVAEVGTGANWEVAH